MVLIIKANPKTAENSVGLKVGQVFVNAYKEANPTATITEINLYERLVPEIDGDMLTAWAALQKGTAFTDLSNEQQEKLEAANNILDEFINHDKHVFITPMWNFIYPARLKSYLDALCVAGKTFKYTEAGPIGLIKGKKALHIHASGGKHNGAQATTHLNGLLNFIGIDDIETLIIEGHEQTPDKADEIIKKAEAKAKEIALRF